MSKSTKPKVPENYGPAAILERLEQQGLGDGPLARSLRQHLADPRPGGIVIRSTMRGTAEDQIQQMRAALSKIQTDLAICQNQLMQAIEAEPSSLLNAEILSRIEDSLRECRLAVA